MSHGTDTTTAYSKRSDTPGHIRVWRSSSVKVLATAFVAILLAVFLRVFVIHAYRIPSASMEPTLLVGDFLLAERLTFGSTVEFPWSRRTDIRLQMLNLPKRGEIVIFLGWEGNRIEYIKRCVGVPGDTIEVVDGQLLINGAPCECEHSQTKHDISFDSRDAAQRLWWHQMERLRSLGPHLIPTGSIFVMGDNRNNSDDSRMNGDVPFSALRGRPLFIYWSVDRDAPWWNPLKRVRWERIGRRIR